MKGYITYFAVGDGFVKIGRSTNPKRRLRNLQSGSPFKLNITKTTKVPEALVQEIFKEQKHSAEWYTIEGTLKQYLQDEIKLAELCGDLDLEKQLIIKATEAGDEELLKHHLHGPDYYFAICDVDNWLREQYKYHETESVGVEQMRDMIRELLDARNLTLLD